ncbi:MAG TPA: capsule biosynthesis protein CapC [Limnochordia bacterium]|nr:capsule biosynthesis protein CapC [Limnochordia bacterium]
MIDLHTHILPGVDDGAADLETAVAMARSAAERGVEVICATPHYYGGLTWQAVQKQVESLRRQLAQAQIPVEVVAGAELMLDTDLLKLGSDEIPTYGGNSRFCLLEFPMYELPMYLEQVLFSLQTKGITPIIAHPERYREVMADPNVVLAWLEQGCLIQVNTGSILGRFGSAAAATAEILLEHDLAQFVASDAHSLKRRPPDLPEAYAVLVQLVGAERAGELVEHNPRGVIAGNFTPKRAPRPFVKKRRFFLFRR